MANSVQKGELFDTIPHYSYMSLSYRTLRDAIECPDPPIAEIIASDVLVLVTLKPYTNDSGYDILTLLAGMGRGYFQQTEQPSKQENRERDSNVEDWLSDAPISLVVRMSFRVNCLISRMYRVLEDVNSIF
jgi:hypothetical protein